MNNTYIPERFRRFVELHIVKNIMTKITGRVPLLLGIHGTSGDGKTYQCEQVLDEIGAKVFLISGGQLESPDSGKPAQIVRNTYLKASDWIEKGKCKVAVILINDIDTGLGNWGEMFQYTVNTQTVFGELMHLVDYPNLVEDISTRRIPIIITGNDFTKLYEPLVRAGRMTAFEWKPTIEEKVEIVRHIFPEINSRKDCERLINEFQSQPIAFFSYLRASLIDDDLWKEIKSVGGTKKAIEFITNPQARSEPDLKPKIQIERLLQAAKNLLESGQLINHLRIK